jgi:hypothetical protein
MLNMSGWRSGSSVSPSRNKCKTTAWFLSSMLLMNLVEMWIKIKYVHQQLKHHLLTCKKYKLFVPNPNLFYLNSGNKNL